MSAILEFLRENTLTGLLSDLRDLDTVPKPTQPISTRGDKGRQEQKTKQNNKKTNTKNKTKNSKCFRSVVV